ncbi:MAG: hypothetical protein KAR23_04190 [Candidatus Aenigmarchaeota archaeon]|nr:hypothetical protein [Candidatus Aenigmarchaeota archaeon]
MSDDKSKKELIPSITKDLKSFMLEERGGASKQALISFGALLTGIEIVGFLSNVVSGARISALHDHCDPGHKSVKYGSACAQHSSANADPASHCSAHCSRKGWEHNSINAGHKNYVYLNYG